MVLGVVPMCPSPRRDAGVDDRLRHHEWCERGGHSRDRFGRWGPIGEHRRGGALADPPRDGDSNSPVVGCEAHSGRGRCRREQEPPEGEPSVTNRKFDSGLAVPICDPRLRRGDDDTPGLDPGPLRIEGERLEPARAQLEYRDQALGGGVEHCRGRGLLPPLRYRQRRRCGHRRPLSGTDGRCHDDRCTPRLLVGHRSLRVPCARSSGRDGILTLRGRVELLHGADASRPALSGSSPCSPRAGRKSRR